MAKSKATTAATAANDGKLLPLACEFVGCLCQHLLSLWPILLLFQQFTLTLAELPQELDPFLERLFETTECESFLADGTYLAVATRECPPFRCDFPRQLCMRSSSQYQQESANHCRALPDQCLLAANGGKPLPAPQTTTMPPPPPSVQQPEPSEVEQPEPGIPPEQPEQPATQTPPIRATSALAIVRGTAAPLPPNVAAGSGGISRGRQTNNNICEQGPPEGRFCGFALKFAYNRETRSCDQFWFPGCRTEQTNDNLFDTLAECLQAARHCTRAANTFGAVSSRRSGGQPQLPPPPLPPPQQPNPASASSSSSFIPTRVGPSSSPYQPAPVFIPEPPPPSPALQPQPNSPLGQAGNFIRLITNTIRGVREQGAGGGAAGGLVGGGDQGLRWDSPQGLGGLLQSLGGK